MKQTVIKGILSSLLGLAVAVGSVGASHASDTIKIGDINSYTRLPALAVPYKNGAMLAIEQINASGGVLGKQLELVSRDDDGKPGTAVKIASEMLAKDDVALISGSIFSHVGIALSGFAKKKKVLYVAAEPLADALVWSKGNKYTFRLRPSTYMQAAMLATKAAKNPAKRWATIAPNYAYGKDAVASFKSILGALRPDVEFVAEQWPGLFKIDAAAESQAILRSKPDAIFNVTFGSDLAKLVREGKLRGVFEDRLVVSLLTGEPEFLDPLKAEAPEGWLVTGYPWYSIKNSSHDAFVKSYVETYNDTPRTGSIVGYNAMLAISEAIKRAGSTDTEALVAAFEGLSFESPTGNITFREIDHQSTMGAYVGYTTVNDGKGVMRDWTYMDGGDFLPTDAEVMKLRPQNK